MIIRAEDNAKLSGIIFTSALMQDGLHDDGGKPEMLLRRFFQPDYARIQVFLLR